MSILPRKRSVISAMERPRLTKTTLWVSYAIFSFSAKDMQNDEFIDSLAPSFCDVAPDFPIGESVVLLVQTISNILP
jgi:hypothetical protein